MGAVLYELLVGRPPFTGANHVQLLRAIERSDARIPAALEASLSRTNAHIHNIVHGAVIGCCTRCCFLSAVTQTTWKLCCTRGMPIDNRQHHDTMMQQVLMKNTPLWSSTAACRALITALLKRNPVERISFEELFNHPFLNTLPPTNHYQDATPPAVDQPADQSMRLVDAQLPPTAFACTVLEHVPTTLVGSRAISVPATALALQSTATAAHPLGEAVPVAQGGGARVGPRAKPGHASVDDEDYVMVDSCPFSSGNRADSHAEGHVNDRDRGGVSLQGREDKPGSKPSSQRGAQSVHHALSSVPSDLAVLGGALGPPGPPPGPDPFADDDPLSEGGLVAPPGGACVFPLQPTEQDVMWEVARTLDYLACCQHEVCGRQ